MSTVPARVEPVNVDLETLEYLGLPPDSVPVRALVLLAHRYQLDPLLGEIQIIQTKQGPKVYISRDGLLAIAHRSGMLDGIVVAEQRRNSTKDGWTAYVEVWRKDMGHPFRYGAQCKDSERQAQTGNGPEMALARAERRALRRAFVIHTDFVPGRSGVIDVEDYDDDTPALDAETQAALDDDQRFAPAGDAHEDDLGRPFEEPES